MTFKDKINDLIGKVVNSSSQLSQEETARAAVEKTITEGMPELARKMASEGAVLLKNENQLLPLAKGTKVSLFGRTYYDYFYVGYGSGGDVNRPYAINLAEGIENCEDLELNKELHNVYLNWIEKNPVSHGYWAHWPLRYEEMPLDDNTVEKAAQSSDVAVVTIGRSSGEDRDSELGNGSYYLHDQEVEMLNIVSKYFSNIVVLLNVGAIIDMSWVKHFKKISSVMYVWQGGMESGNAVADLLCGKACPSGRLTDTISKEYYDQPSSICFGNKKANEYTEDIFVGYRYFETFAPDKVSYPFGFGLSYTNFEITHKNAKAVDGGFEFTVEVKNIGDVAGKEVIQLYLQKPCIKLGNPARELVAFAKTDILEPNQTQELTMLVDMYQLTAFDDCGSTNNGSCYVIENGDYNFFVGKDVRNNEKVFTYYQPETKVFEQVKQVSAPKADFKVFRATMNEDGEYCLDTKWVAKEKYDLASRILYNLPETIEQTGDKGYKLQDVKDGKVTLDQFVAQLNDEELEAITRGGYKMDHPLGPKGNAGIYGGVLESLRDKGIRPVVTTDGPSGIRLTACCSLLPIGTLMACSFNTALVEEIYTVVAGELKEKGSDVLLAPGMNIHRNPLCGRNFEYFSEDPYLTGKFGAACVRGIQSLGASACPKHFACNNQEYFRNVTDSQISERALREIYLKGFEICIAEGAPKNIMTSYNKINGVWSHYNYDLCVTVLRKEWGYEGNVMTDWWMKPSKSIEFPNMRDQAYRVRSGVNLLMPGGDRVTNEKPDGTLLATVDKKNGITRGEIQESAKWILKSVMAIE